MNILIADDQAHVASLLQEQVRPWGYEAVLVHDGQEALDALRAPDGPRVALLDWLMPGLDGIEVCRILREAGTDPYPYLLVMTGQGGREQMLEGLEAGADDFLAKPVDAAELKARLGAGRRIMTLQSQLKEQATRDALTGMLNRGAVLDRLEREAMRSRREGRSFGVILADLDHFKRINDVHGHLAGDAILREAASRLLGALRPYDTVGRYGGEEFLLVLPGCDSGTLADLADRLCQAVAVRPVFCEAREPICVTISVGAASWQPEEPVEVIELLRAADDALYRAKAEGRNRAALALMAQRVIC